MRASNFFFESVGRASLCCDSRSNGEKAGIVFAGSYELHAAGGASAV